MAALVDAVQFFQEASAQRSKGTSKEARKRIGALQLGGGKGYSYSSNSTAVLYCNGRPCFTEVVDKLIDHGCTQYAVAYPYMDCVIGCV